MPIFADLHIHTHYSDGTMSPDMVARRAAARGVGLIAVADHNVLAGSHRLMKCCRREGIRCLPAVELDTLEDGRLQHILGYGVDLDDRQFIDFCRGNRLRLDRLSEILVERMAHDVPAVSLDDYHRFAGNVHKGGWKALHYFLARGVTSALKQGIGLYERYQCHHSIAGFPSVAEACRAIHAASGRAVLAHPGEMIDTADLTAFTGELDVLASRGLDGVECHYPTHTAEVTGACVDFCNRNGLLITAGSDCHGGFGRTEIGQMNVTLDQLNLGGLV